MAVAELLADNADVYIVANTKSKESKAIAEYYAQRRSIPKANIIELNVPDTPALSRLNYQKKLANPLIAELIKRGAITASEISKDASTARPTYLYTTQKIKFLVLCKMPFKVTGVKEAKPSGASVDSELAATFLPMKSLNGSVKNPLYKNYDSPELYKTCGVLRVARLDGKDFKEAKAIIDSAILAEQNGARGRVYIDKNQKKGGYQIGNNWLSAAENILGTMNFDMSVDDRSALFAHDNRFDAPLFYFGWYSSQLVGYFLDEPVVVPAGAFGLHIYSFSATNLSESGWTSALMNRHFSQSYGNVYEPYLTGTQDMGALMEALSKGKSAGEASYASIPSLSWRSLVVGDPLFQPFKVSLQEQISRIDSGKIDELSQYSIIRQINKMKADGADVSSRLEFAKKYIDTMPNFALKWKIVELLVETGDKKATRATMLELYNQKIWLNRDFVGLSIELAKNLVRYGNFVESMSIYNSLIELKMSDAFYRAVVKNAAKLARGGKVGLSEKMSTLKLKFDAQDAEKKATAEKSKKATK